MGAKPRRLPGKIREAEGAPAPRVPARDADAGARSHRALPGEDERIGALRRAILFGDESTAKRLLAEGMDPGTRGKDGHTLVCTAIMEGDDPIAKLIIDHARSLEVRCKKESHHGAGSTPLCGAVFRGRLELVKLLLERGARVDATLHGGMGALHTAAFVGRPAAIPVLVRAGADVNARSDRGLTPLHYAAHRGRPNAARALLSHGAEVDARIGSGTTPLTLATAAEQLEVAHVLIRAGARADRIFHAAATAGLLHIVDLLIDADAEVLRQPEAMRAAKEAAQRADNRELAELLETITRFPLAAIVARRLEKRAYQEAVAGIYRRYTSNTLPFWMPETELESRVEELAARIGESVCAAALRKRKAELETRAVIQLAAEANPDMARNLADQLDEMVAATGRGSPPKGIRLSILQALVENLDARGKLAEPADVQPE